MPVLKKTRKDRKCIICGNVIKRGTLYFPTKTAIPMAKCQQCYQWGFKKEDFE